MKHHMPMVRLTCCRLIGSKLCAYSQGAMEPTIGKSDFNRLFNCKNAVSNSVNCFSGIIRTHKATAVAVIVHIVRLTGIPRFVARADAARLRFDVTQLHVAVSISKIDLYIINIVCAGVAGSGAVELAGVKSPNLFSACTIASAGANDIASAVNWNSVAGYIDPGCVNIHHRISHIFLLLLICIDLQVNYKREYICQYVNANMFGH